MAEGIRQNETWVAPAITERDYATQIDDLLIRFGWQYYHVYEQSQYARRSTEGFPDYIAMRPPRLLAIELKSDKGQLTPEQYFWLAGLELCGIPSYLWQPKDDINEIVKVLE